MNKRTLIVTSALRRNNREFPKPNEDHILIDEENGIFILLDGITRVHSEYDGAGDYSAAKEISRIFAATAYEHIVANLHKRNIRKVISQSILLGNRQIAQFRTRRSQEEWGFYPGTLGIIALIRGTKLYYACAGDCTGMLLRDSSRIYFGEQQAVKAVDLMKPSKQERYALYCNHPENDLSYAIFNGDDAALDGYEQSYLDLHPGDRIYLVSDGAAPFIKYAKTAQLASMDATQILDASQIYDVPPFAKYADDKAVITIEIQ